MRASPRRVGKGPLVAQREPVSAWEASAGAGPLPLGKTPGLALLIPHLDVCPPRTGPPAPSPGRRPPLRQPPLSSSSSGPHPGPVAAMPEGSPRRGPPKFRLSSLAPTWGLGAPSRRAPSPGISVSPACVLPSLLRRPRPREAVPAPPPRRGTLSLLLGRCHCFPEHLLPPDAPHTPFWLVTLCWAIAHLPELRHISSPWHGAARTCLQVRSG